ncbi:MAG: HD domain-containing protein [Coriobacteriales bacterium]|nr:HD domain-containing protein [Coriobacteriales bacterium]
MRLPPHVTAALERLEGAGLAAFVVGGCVRDALMGREPHDWDIATSAKPARVKELFADSKVLETGIRHGTLTVLGAEGPLEVTTFRSEGDYLDARRPASVTFIARIEDDLARRDFTMNALAFNPRTGLVDPFGGRADIERRLIRSVGDADERLREDALRIMRALRFSATLDLTLDAALDRQLRKNRQQLAHIAAERTGDELLRMLVGPRILPVLLTYPDVLAVLVPEIAPAIGHGQRSVYHRYDIWEHTAHAVACARPEPPVRLALLMHDLGKPDTFFIGEDGQGHFYGHDKRGEELARARLKALRFPRELQDCVAALVRDHQKPLTPQSMLRWLNRLGERQLRLLIEVKRGDIAAHADDVVERGLAELRLCEERLDELVAQRACFSLRDLAVNGKDLLAAGVPPGREVGRVLACLLDAVMDGEVANTREDLLALSSKFVRPRA